MKSVTRHVATEADMHALGARFASALGALRLVALNGPLGAGKTTLVRGLLRALGHTGGARSPTFTLVEEYSFDDAQGRASVAGGRKLGATGRRLYHFDLYRLKDPEELEFLGLRDYLTDGNLCVVEWAERAGRFLPAPDVTVMIAPVDHGRSVTLTAHTPQGEAWLGGF